jgi:hypothetical protein
VPVTGVAGPRPAGAAAPAAGASPSLHDDGCHGLQRSVSAPESYFRLGVRVCCEEAAVERDLGDVQVARPAQADTCGVVCVGGLFPTGHARSDEIIGTVS